MHPGGVGDTAQMIRGFLRHLLTVRDETGTPVVVAERLLTEIAEDLSGHGQMTVTPDELREWAMSEGSHRLDPNALYTVAEIHGRYRQMIGLWRTDWPLEWMRREPSKRWQKTW